MKKDKKFVVVDYVNDQYDLHKKSKFTDGLPDEVVEQIIDSIVIFVKQNTNNDKLSGMTIGHR